MKSIYNVSLYYFQLKEIVLPYREKWLSISKRNITLIDLITFFKGFNLDLALAESLIGFAIFIHFGHLASASMISSDKEKGKPIDLALTNYFLDELLLSHKFQQWKSVRFAWPASASLTKQYNFKYLLEVFLPHYKVAGLKFRSHILSHITQKMKAVLPIRSQLNTTFLGFESGAKKL